jgi:hypothetical protein
MVLASILLLPLLYCLHQVQRFFPFLGWREAGLTLIQLGSLAALSWLTWFLVTRNAFKSNWLNILWLLLVSFFSPLFDFLKDQFGGIFFLRYQFLLPLIGLIFLLVIWRVFRSNRSFVRRSEFVVLVFVMFMIIDAGKILYKYSRPMNSGTVFLEQEEPFKSGQTKKKSLPDIYFLVFDELAGSQALEQEFGYHNLGLDSFLTAKGFLVTNENRSNYNWTQFSIASILNMSYLRVPRRNALQFDDYVSAMNLIRHNRLTPWLEDQGYRVLNYSAFDLEGHPAQVQYMRDNFRINQMNRDLFWNRIYQDIGWHFHSTKSEAADTTDMYEEMEFSAYNQRKTFSLVKAAAEHRADQPQFVYGHFFIPHAPFLEDSLGNRRPARELLIDGNAVKNYIQAYLQYLPAVKEKIKDLVGFIQGHSTRPTVIIVMGDHGFRHGSQQEVNPFVFRNFFAILLPEGADPRAYEKITGVNLFRQLIPYMTGTSLPVLPDSLIFLRDRK